MNKIAVTVEFEKAEDAELFQQVFIEDERDITLAAPLVMAYERAYRWSLHDDTEEYGKLLDDNKEYLDKARDLLQIIARDGGNADTSEMEQMALGMFAEVVKLLLEKE